MGWGWGREDHEINIRTKGTKNRLGIPGHVTDKAEGAPGQMIEQRGTSGQVIQQTGLAGHQDK